MRLSVSAAARLYGKPRKTLYRHMASGRLSYSVEGDTGRELDMAELIRCYGEPQVPATGQTQPQMSQVDTSGDTPRADAALLEEIRRQTAVIEKMSERIERLESAMLALPSPAPRESETARPDPASSEPPRDFSDLLARFEKRRR